MCEVGGVKAKRLAGFFLKKQLFCCFKTHRHTAASEVAELFITYMAKER